MHYYQFNIADYRKDTVHLSRLEHGIYRDLIDWYYLEESPIPKETQWVSRRLRLATEEEARALKNVLNDFFVSDGDVWRHPRIDADIKEYHAQCEKNRANGKKGGRPKGAAKRPKTQSVSNGLPVETQTDATANPNHKPLTTNQEPITNSKKESTKENPCVADRSTALTGDAPLDESKNTPPDKPTKKTKRFVKPSLEELTEYFRERGITKDAEAAKFHDYYESNGWRVGKNPMKDWRSAVRNWIRQSENFAKSSGNSEPTPKKSFEVF